MFLMERGGVFAIRKQTSIAFCDEIYSERRVYVLRQSAISPRRLTYTTEGIEVLKIFRSIVVKTTNPLNSRESCVYHYHSITATSYVIRL